MSVVVVERERVCICRLGTCLPTSMFIISIRLERTASFDTISVVLLSRSDWPLLTTTYWLMRRLGIIVSLCVKGNEFEKRDRTERLYWRC